jgi:cobalamin biosynthetic protein CobC
LSHLDARPLAHGGDLGAARLIFPGAPEPFVDLSTGINPHAYPIPRLEPEAFRRLPEPAALARLRAIAAQAYGAPSAAHVVAAPGTQILLPHVAALGPAGRAAVLGPTYSEHARVARLLGHAVTEVAEVGQLGGADLAIVVNPNNPDGRIMGKAGLLVVAEELRRRGGLLMVDEAFMDVGPAGASLGDQVGRGNIVVLRSFGKFFGLAGLRLGFALAAPDITARVDASLGPWAVAGPAIAIGETALTDVTWAEATRALLAREARQLDAVLTEAGLELVGGTSLYRLVRAPAASDLYHHLGRAGILVRRFSEQPTWLRLGLPAGEEAWHRLRAALAAFPDG